jgi:hypothetical protein
VKGTSNIVVVLDAGAAAQDLGKPELANGALHVANLALGRTRCLDPLRRLAANTTDHVGMGEGLWSTLLRLDVESRRDWLCNSRVKRRGATGNHEIVSALVAGAGPAITFAGPRAGEGRVSVERGRHRGRLSLVIQADAAS